MTDTAITIELVKFPCIPWVVQGTFGDRMQPVPGTWTLTPESLAIQGIKGVICCPNRECAQAVLVRYDMGEIDNGTLNLDSLSCRKCGLMIHARLLEWDTRKLFCVAYEITREDGTVVPRKEYLHAENREQAIVFFMSGTGYLLDRDAMRWRMVDTGLAIGYFGQRSDKDQIRLTVD